VLTTTSASFVVAPPPPTVTATAPNNRGQGATNQNVTIIGTFFRAGATASFGSGVTVNSTTVVSATQLTANVSIDPGTSTGTRDVTVTNPNGGGTATCTACFTVTASPGAAISLSPNSRGRGATSQTITVTGSSFQSGAVVVFGASGITVNSTTFVSATQLTVNVTVAANAALGANNVTVTNPDGGTRTATNAFTVVAAPAPVSVSPPARGQGVSNQFITITGSSFQSGAVAAFTGSGITVNSTTFVSATQLTVNVSVAANATVGASNVSVTNPDAGTGLCAGCFTVNAAPTVSSIDANFGVPNTTYPTVTVTGANFGSGATVAIGTGVTVSSVSVVNATQLTISITVTSGATLGARNVTVTNADGGAGVCTGCYTVTAGPTATGASPSSRGQGATNQNITVTGTFFRPGASVAMGTGVTINSTTFVSATQLTVNVTVPVATTTGVRNVVVTNPTGFGSATCTSCFTVAAAPGATITLNPNNRGQGATNQNVTVTGSNFQSGATVAFSGTGITVNSTTFVSATQLTVNLSVATTATVGARSVTVSNPNAGTRTVANAFTVIAGPTATSISPNPRGQGFSGTVTVTGTNFVTGATAAFSGVGITVNSTTFSSATQLSVNITIAAGAATGARNLTVTNTNGGSATCTGCLTVTTQPLPTSLNPANRAPVTSGTHTITGTGFQSGATVTVSGLLVGISNVTFVSSTQLTITVNALLGVVLGPRNITVTNPDGGTGTCTGCLTIGF
jgi:hypothetical protein